MKFFTLKTGIILLATELILAIVFFAAAGRDNDVENTTSRTQSMPRENPIRSFEAYRDDRRRNGDQVSDQDFVEYAKEVLEQHGSKGVPGLLELTPSLSRDEILAFFALLAEKQGLAAALVFEKFGFDDQLEAKIALVSALYAAEESPREVIEFVSTFNPYLFTDDMLLGLLVRSKKLSLSEKFDFLRTVPKGECRRSAVDFLAQEAAANGTAPEREALQASGIFTEKQLDLYSAVYGHHLITRDLAKGIEYMERNEFNPSVVNYPNLRDYARLHAAKDPEKAFALSSQVTDSRVRLELLKGTVVALVRTKPEKGVAMAKAEFDEGRDNGQLLQNAYAHWLAMRPADAASHLAQSGLDEGSRHKILADNFSVVVDRDPQFAKSLIANHSGTLIEDSLRATYGKSVASSSQFGDRVAVVSEIREDYQRSEVLHDMALSATVVNRAQVGDYLAVAERGASTDAVILGFTRQSFYDNRFDYAAQLEVVARVSDPVLQRQLLKEWYQKPAEGDGAAQTIDAQRNWEASNPDLAREFNSEASDGHGGGN